MPLESLNNEQINIHDLTLEQEKKAMPEWQKQYEALKETPLYSHELGLWCDFFNLGEEHFGRSTPTKSQHWGIMIESNLNPKKAEKIYDNIKDRRFYDSDRKLWQLYYDVTDDKPSGVNFIYTISQLTGVLAELKIDKPDALQNFEKAKEDFFDTKHNLWMILPDKEEYKAGDRNHLGRLDIDAETTFSSDNQLLAVLIEHTFDQPKARKDYETIKEKCFNEETGLWFFSFSDSEEPQHISIDSQLLGVLAEAKFDKENAKEIYENLKSKHRDENGLWVTRTPEMRNSRSRYSDSQLLGVLCEKEFEEEPNLDNPTPALPEERNY